MSLSKVAESVIDCGLEYGQFIINNSLWDSIYVAGEEVPKLDSRAVFNYNDPCPSEFLLHGKSLRSSTPPKGFAEEDCYMSKISEPSTKQRSNTRRSTRTDSGISISRMDWNPSELDLSPVDTSGTRRSAAYTTSIRPSVRYPPPVGSKPSKVAIEPAQSILPPSNAPSIHPPNHVQSLLPPNTAQVNPPQIQAQIIPSNQAQVTPPSQTQVIPPPSQVQVIPPQNQAQIIAPPHRREQTWAQAVSNQYHPDQQYQDPEYAGRQRLLWIARSTRSVSRKTLQEAERVIISRDLASSTTWCQQRGICLPLVSISQGIPPAR
jgi:hypothetical protein